MQKILMALVFILMAANGFGQKLYTATGRASFYANKFDGRRTANGEIFSNKKMTAAHLKLPFGTMVKVTNPKNNKSVVVRINDRGPYVKSRLIDLSRAAADSLDIIHSGWAMVKVEEVPPAQIEVQAELPDVPLVDPYQLRFPEDWIGNWEGILKIYSSRGLEKNVQMKLNIAHTDSLDRYTWTILYDSLPRNYELIRRDSSKGIFSLDEKNGIDIMSTILGNHFLSRFSVSGNLLDCEYHLLNRNEMTFEIRTGNEERHWTTGNVVMQKDSIPEVAVYSIGNLQVAILQRVQ